MASKALRRLAADHGALYSQILPPNYLFAADASTSDDLTQLDILLAGPSHTPFQAGVWRLHLTIPPEYPQSPPTAHFRTPIFHPNVHPETGGVCVETLKRDWDIRLTLRDVLITISCLLIYPNPDSALNAGAGALIQDSYDAFARRAELMTSIHARIPAALRTAVHEAQMRGQEVQDDRASEHPDAAPRKRRATSRQRGTAVLRKSDGSPTSAFARRRQHGRSSQALPVQMRHDDIFSVPERLPESVGQDEDSSMLDADQENTSSKAPLLDELPLAGTPRRPHGVAVPLGEMIMDDILTSTDEDEDMEPEYPPSPRKSPFKSPSKRPTHPPRAESSRAALARAPNITPPNDPNIKPLAQDSPFAASPSPRKTHSRPQTPVTGRAPLFPALTTPRGYHGIFKVSAPTSAEKKVEEARRKAERDAKLWELCGGDIKRWNRGDFDGEPFEMKARRW